MMKLGWGRKARPERDGCPTGGSAPKGDAALGWGALPESAPDVQGDGGDATSRPHGRRLARRTFLGLGGIAALSLLIGNGLAWGGVGGGAWGSAGGTAYPGSRFGYDGGWGYSRSRKVWLAVSCNATVGRMTELFLEISVSSYYANGGRWSPTWSTDYPDTHVDSFVRNGAGQWVSSTSGFYDTTYDCAVFQGPYATHRLRVQREAWDWWAWAGVRAWCDSPDNAYGIDTVAEASQLIPRHSLVDDRTWQGKIATLRPEAAPHLLISAAGGGLSNGTNVEARGCLDTTSQHWLVLTSAQGRTCLVPVHTGNAPLFADVSSNDWGDGDNVHLWGGTGGWNQSFWLHGLGDGYHLIVPECSGCALDLAGGGQADGTNVAQWNCYGNWSNPSQRWKLEEPVFREREPGALALGIVGGTGAPGGAVGVDASGGNGGAVGGDVVASGEATPGAVLAPGDPAQACLPRNHPGTAGLFYRAAWYRGERPGDRAALVREASEEMAYSVAEADEGAYLTCVVTAHARYGDVPYRGEAVAPSVLVRPARVRVRFFADGEASPCFTAEPERGSAFAVPHEAGQAAAKPGCAGVDGWYRGRRYEQPYLDGSPAEGDFDLFARNRVELSYGMADRSCVLDPDRAFFRDEALIDPLGEPALLLPPAAVLFYGERVSFARGASAWCEDMGRVREAACAPGAYASPEAVGPALRTARLVRNTTVYLVWRTPAYDGIAVSKQ